MAQTLEKIFLQKVASMPQEEQELVVTIPKNSHKKGAKLAGRKRRSFANEDRKMGKIIRLNFFSLPQPQHSRAVSPVPIRCLLSLLCLTQPCILHHLRYLPLSSTFPTHRSSLRPFSSPCTPLDPRSLLSLQLPQPSPLPRYTSVDIFWTMRMERS